jgi:hypothetical protein
MFPRFVDRCCRTAGHMTKEDILVMSGFRKTVDCDLVEELEELGVEVVPWYTLLGWEGEPGPDELSKKDVLCNDGVHLTHKANAFAAVSLCCRVAEVEVFVKSDGVSKKRRME